MLTPAESNQHRSPSCAAFGPNVGPKRPSAELEEAAGAIGAAATMGARGRKKTGVVHAGLGNSALSPIATSDIHALDFRGGPERPGRFSNDRVVDVSMWRLGMVRVCALRHFRLITRAFPGRKSSASQSPRKGRNTVAGVG